jgi:hypothetical protein
MKKIIPDQQAFENVQRTHPTASDAEKYRLAQADTLLRIAKVDSLDELHKMAAAGLLDQLVEDHNAALEQGGSS